MKMVQNLSSNVRKKADMLPKFQTPLKFLVHAWGMRQNDKKRKITFDLALLQSNNLNTDQQQFVVYILQLRSYSVKSASYLEEMLLKS